MNFKELRLSAGYSQTSLGKAVEVEQSCVSHWERGLWKPTRKMYPKIAKAFKCRVEDVAAALDQTARELEERNGKGNISRSPDQTPGTVSRP